MKTILSLIILFSFATIMFTIDNKRIENNYQPQDSELALLMRKIHEDAKSMRVNLLEDKKDLVYDPGIEFILNATPTRPAVQGPEFEAFSRYYIAKVKEATEEADSKTYNEMVEACVTCHKEFCPGPIKTINKLMIRDASASR